MIEYALALPRAAHSYVDSKLLTIRLISKISGSHLPFLVNLAARMSKMTNEQKRQIAIAAAIFLAIAVVICGLLLWVPHVPGFLGEWLGFMMGMATTPFLLEISFALFGLTLVLVINHLRQTKAGDELVYLEQVNEPAGLPEHASWAVYREPPLAGEEPSLHAQAEGALAIADHETAAECIAAMTEDELKLPQTLALRIDLAKATGREQLAAELEAQLGAYGDPRI